jgi:excisionase family DNA binding protein
VEQPQRSDALQQLVDQLDAAEASGVLARVREVLALANDLLAKVQDGGEAASEKRGRGRPRKWLSIKDAARELERSEHAIRRWIHKDAMPGHKIGGEYRILRKHFEEWLEEQRVRPPG